MSAVELFKQATRRVCEEGGESWTEGSDAEFEHPSVVRLADVFAELVLAERAAELEQEARLIRARMERLEDAHKEWSDKTDWVQSSAQARELGMHRADVLRTRIGRLQAERDGIVVAILDQIKMANGPRSVSEMVIRNRFMPERPCVVHLPADDTEGGLP